MCKFSPQPIRQQMENGAEELNMFVDTLEWRQIPSMNIQKIGDWKQNIRNTNTELHNQGWDLYQMKPAW